MTKPKLRKMLGSSTAPCTVALMQLIDTQSRQTICTWCLDYAQQHILPIYEKHCPCDKSPQNALEAAQKYLEGEHKFSEVKKIILNECHAAARELDKDPAAQAAARACGQASSVVHTLSHSLGLYFYGAAAIAYDRVGLCESAEVYEALAQDVCADITEALKAIAIKDEPNPATITWHC